MVELRLLGATMYVLADVLHVDPPFHLLFSLYSSSVFLITPFVKLRLITLRDFKWLAIRLLLTIDME